MDKSIVVIKLNSKKCSEPVLIFCSSFPRSVTKRGLDPFPSFAAFSQMTFYSFSLVNAAETTTIDIHKRFSSHQEYLNSSGDHRNRL